MPVSATPAAPASARAWAGSPVSVESALGFAATTAIARGAPATRRPYQAASVSVFSYEHRLRRASRAGRVGNAAGGLDVGPRPPSLVRMLSIRMSRAVLLACSLSNACASGAPVQDGEAAVGAGGVAATSAGGANGSDAGGSVGDGGSAPGGASGGAGAAGSGAASASGGASGGASGAAVGGNAGAAGGTAVAGAGGTSAVGGASGGAAGGASGSGVSGGGAAQGGGAAGAATGGTAGATTGGAAGTATGGAAGAATGGATQGTGGSPAGAGGMAGSAGAQAGSGGLSGMAGAAAMGGTSGAAGAGAAAGTSGTGGATGCASPCPTITCTVSGIQFFSAQGCCLGLNLCGGLSGGSCSPIALFLSQFPNAKCQLVRLFRRFGKPGSDAWTSRRTFSRRRPRRCSARAGSSGVAPSRSASAAPGAPR